MIVAGQRLLSTRLGTGDDNLLRFLWRVVAAHMATYLIAGFAAFYLLDYASLWDTEPLAHYRPLDSPWVAAGPGLQIVRGLILGAVLFPFRRVFLGGDGGWLKLWAVLVGIGVLATYAAAPGSLEGVIFTDLPVFNHLIGIPELWGSTLAFSFVLVGWYRRPHLVWNLSIGAVAALAVLVSVLGVFLSAGA